ncbi:hypothetical protein KA107_02620 [Candidatus Pacearchaeota archaeon]|nr:hypothetical protein [Candidatus Pacearchaeota archaeon]
MNSLESQLTEEITNWTEEFGQRKSSLEGYNAISFYAAKGTDPKNFERIAGWAEAVFSVHKAESLPETYRSEEDLPYLAILRDPTFLLASERFKGHSQAKIKSVAKSALSLVFSCDEKTDAKKLETAYDRIKDWTKYLSSSEIIETVEISLIADLAYLTMDSNTIGSFAKPHKLVATLEKSMAEEINPENKEELKNYLAGFVRTQEANRGALLASILPGYQNLAQHFTRKMQFLRVALKENYQIDNFREILATEEFGDNWTKPYFAQFFDGGKK